jgi:hypothetical protein
MRSTGEPRTEPAWRRISQLLGVFLLTVAHVTSLVVGGYDEWPGWAVAANFAGLLLFCVPAVVARLAR